jgi:hypothetical protein
MSALRSFDQFRAAVLADVSDTVKKESATPPPHLVIEDADGTLQFHGPLFTSEDDKNKAPNRMRGLIRQLRPPRLAVVMEAFSIDRPTDEERRKPLRDNPRAIHIVNVWFFRRGSGESEDWSAGVVTGKDDRISLGEWKALDYTGKVKNGFLWDPVAETMAERRDGPAPRSH